MKHHHCLQRIFPLLLVLLLAVWNLPLQAKKKQKPEKETVLAIDAIVHEKLPRGSRVGIYVYDLDNNSIIYEQEPNIMCQPASCQKLLTTISTLDLEQDKPFKTQFWINGRLLQDSNHRNILQGDMYIVGGFDPTLSVSNLDNIIRELRLSKITGTVYADVSAMDSVYFGPGWWWDDAQFAFQPYVSPLIVNQGKVTAYVSPTFSGSPAKVRIEPGSSYYKIENNSVTVPADSASTARISRKWMQNMNTIVIDGNVNSRSMKEMNLFSSQDMFMQIFMERLKSNGVECSGKYQFAELATDTVPGSLEIISPQAELYYQYTTPFDSILYPMLKDSRNLYAECMLFNTAANTLNRKHLSWGQAVIPEKELARGLNFEEGTYAIKDGSGLSNVNFISPRQLVGLLQYAYNKPKIFDHLYPALPVNGTDGTLKNRMSGAGYTGRVHAKTGSLSVASTLAGYIRMRNGRMAAFCIMNQNYIGASKARAMQDAVLCYIIDNVR